MSGIDPRADPLLVNGSRLGVTGYFRTATVTLLSAEVDGSMRLWQDKPDVMAAAMGRLNQIVGDVIAAHGGMRPVEHGEGDSFEVAFARASDAVVAALQLQRAPLLPIRLRIGVRTGEVQLHDGDRFAAPGINRTARLRDLAHGGQTVLSGGTVELVADRLPEGAWLSELGAHRLRDLPDPERVAQLCHPDLLNQFPPLRAARTVGSRHLPVQLTSFIGRGVELVELQRIVAEKRLVTLTGAGGVGKTRLAVQVATEMAGRYRDGVWYVDLAPVIDPELLPLAAARAFGLPDQPGRSTMDTLSGFLADRELLVVLDTCEHLLDASAALAVAVLGAAPGLTLLATSREPIGVAGELSWRVPSLSLADEAAELFVDRARHARPDLAVGTDDAAAVAEICARLDGLPLAIELAAARVRALSLAEILDGLHDRFRLLTGGARTAVRRHQTLRASVDWSHALLTDSERVLFRRLAVFVGGFDLDAARAVAAGGDIEHFQVLDQLGLLIDKSLVVADSTGGASRYRLLDTVRQYGAEKLERPARPMPCVRVTATTTRRWPRCSTPRGGLTTGAVWPRSSSRSTTCTRRFRGAASTAIPSSPCDSRPRCSRCGWHGAASAKGWSCCKPRSATSMPSMPTRRCALARSPTWLSWVCGWAPPSVSIRPTGAGARAQGR